MARGPPGLRVNVAKIDLDTWILEPILATFARESGGPLVLDR